MQNQIKNSHRQPHPSPHLTSTEANADVTISTSNPSEPAVIQFWPLVVPKNEQKLDEKFASEHFWQTLSTKSQTIRVNMSGGQREELKGYKLQAEGKFRSMVFMGQGENY
jgi:hypothetical protein